MIRTVLYHNDGRRIRNERAFRNIGDWDLEGEMKVWFEYPESTRFARYPYDILYTPIFFGNEGVSGDLCLEANQSISHEILQLTAELSLIGSASLGLLNVGGRPANIFDTRYAYSTVGFRPIVTIPVLDISDTLSLEAGHYERGNVHGRRIPFSFPLPAQTLAQLRELTPSVKLISSDTETTLGLLKDQCPTMLINVRYVLSAVLFQGDNQKQKVEQEIRIWVALDETQVPSPLPEISDNVTQHRRSSLVPLKRTRSLPFTASRRKSVHEGGTHIIVEAEDPDPFCFQTHNDAAATKVRLTLTYASTNTGVDEAPGPVQANIEWVIKSLSTVAVQPNNQNRDAPPSDDYFHLRTRHLPLKKLKMEWARWEKPDPEEQLGNAWKSVQDLWLTLSTTTGLTPTFRTSFISHSYSMWLRIGLGGKGLKGKSYRVELNVPVKIRYDVGHAPSYTVDHGLPAYEVDEGQNTQQPGPGWEHPYAEPPPPHEDADEHVHTRTPPRYTRDELADLIRNTGLAGEGGRPAEG
ncbi:hypothetical protein LTR70_005817 [Exophiala xenobiotica]|uniref:Arrestin-like N-terminal domain-containing protein n=1 Tax=Lithohypha guttulata TaxID=1690604 RepID=A0ABR0K0N2_9EURO|nr:hypothetical protein LTR24_008210 [Lithohypha guttulata]KAK5317622.1 hypothetical protein LTR70_005817 [Exophiala xenobiotica]